MILVYPASPYRFLHVVDDGLFKVLPCDLEEAAMIGRPVEFGAFFKVSSGRWPGC